MNTYWNLVYRIMHEMEIRLRTIGCEPISDVQLNECIHRRWRGERTELIHPSPDNGSGNLIVGAQYMTPSLVLVLISN